MTVQLDDREAAWLHGAEGPARQLAARLIVAAAEASGATELVPVESAHINSCHYSGRLSLDFAEFLAADDVTFAVPTHTNASLIACDSPWLRPVERSPEAVDGARRLMDIYESLGCTSMWTCAPYQQHEGRPGFATHVIGSESNAVSFVNSVLGARTNKYGDLLDVAGAIVGRVPLAGRHTDEGRRASVVVDVSSVSDRVRDSAEFFHLLGVVFARVVGDEVGAITGLDAAAEDELKAIASAAAAAGGVDLFHVVGVTPEARTLDDATHGGAVSARFAVTDADIAGAASLLNCHDVDGPLAAVCLGTPHFSMTEFAELHRLLDGRRVDASVRFIVTTSRAVSHELALRGIDTELADSGIDVVLDTCTYYPPRPAGVEGVVMTNSAKWAYYAPGMLDVAVRFSSLEACVDAAVGGGSR